jgi:hypothetical protein
VLREGSFSPTDEEESMTWAARRSRGSLCLHRLKATPLDLFRSRSICAAVLLAGRRREEARRIEAGTTRLLRAAGLRIDAEKGGGPAHRRTDGSGEGQGRRWRLGRTRAAARTTREAGPGGGGREKRTQLWSRGSLRHPQEKGPEGGIWVPS